MGITSRSSSQRGVTLIELAVVVVLISALAAIAYPSYRRHVIRLERADARRELQMLAQRLQQCFTRTNSYLSVDRVPNACVTLPYRIPGGTYRITGEITATTYALTALPQGSQMKDAACAGLTLNQMGQHGVTGTGTAQDCWEDQGH